MDNPLIWYGIWLVLLAGFVFILYKEKRKRLYSAYFLTGMAFGFYFDFVSFTYGYYSYPDFYPVRMFGLPLSMTIAEGFSVAITMKLFEFARKFTRASLAP